MSILFKVIKLGHTRIAVFCVESLGNYASSNLQTSLPHAVWKTFPQENFGMLFMIRIKNVILYLILS